ncbi:MAG: hypothetical protein R3C03_13615 [Pirellulaceae bacterium]
MAYERIPSLDDSIVTAGERIAIEIITGYLNRSHANGEFPMRTAPVSALELGLYTDSRFGAANVKWAQAIEHTRETLFANYLERGIMPVVSGFDGIHHESGDFQEGVQRRKTQSRNRVPNKVFRTSLGRGGSDLTAAFLGVALEAEYVGFCKETPGVLTGDDLVAGSDAKTVPVLSYELATEAGNIYSKAVEPVRAARIPIHIFDPTRPEYQTVVSECDLPDGFYLIDRPKESVNIHLGSIPDEPGKLIEYLQLFAGQNVNVEEIRHQHSGTDLIVCGRDSDIEECLAHFHERGLEALAHYTWYIRVIGNISGEMAAQFNLVIRPYMPLSLAAYQWKTKVVTATVARNRTLSNEIEFERIREVFQVLHNDLVVPTTDGIAANVEERVDLGGMS